MTLNGVFYILLIAVIGVASSDDLINHKDFQMRQVNIGILASRRIDLSTIINTAIKSEIQIIHNNLTRKMELESSELESQLTGRINNLEIELRNNENQQRKSELKYQAAVQNLINNLDTIVIRNTLKDQKVIPNQNGIKILITAVISAFFIIMLLIVFTYFLSIEKRSKLIQDNENFGNPKSHLVDYEV